MVKVDITVEQIERIEELVDTIFAGLAGRKVKIFAGCLSEVMDWLDWLRGCVEAAGEAADLVEEVRELAQGEFTKEEADRAIEAVDDMYLSLTSSIAVQLAQRVDDAIAFLQTAKGAAPEKREESYQLKEVR